MKVLNNDSNKHVENKKSDKKKERNEVNQSPFIEVFSGLNEKENKKMFKFQWNKKFLFEN